MARSKAARQEARRKRRKGGGQFIPIPYEMAKSDAWRYLPGNAIKAYVELRRRFTGSNNGELSLSLDEAAKLLHLGKATVQRALVLLEQHGFIRMIKRGHWYGRMASTYAVTDRPIGTQAPTNDWRSWRPPQKDSSVSKRTNRQSDGSAREPSELVYDPLENPWEEI
jgi:hypothetical protein